MGEASSLSFSQFKDLIMDEIIINSTLVRKIINRQASHYAQLEVILAELARRVMSRLDYIKLAPELILDCGSGGGYDYALLCEKYPAAQIVQLDHALKLISQQRQRRSRFQKFFGKVRLLVCADAYQIPLASQSVNLCYANLLLPYLSDIPVFIQEMRRIMRLGGAFCIAGLGVDSFKELRQLGLSTYRFPDMHDIGDMLLAAGFSNPVVDTEYITLEYADLATLFADLKIVACGAANAAQFRRNLNRDELFQLKHKLLKPTKLTLEIFVAHGWKDNIKLDLAAGQSVINFKPRA